MRFFALIPAPITALTDLFIRDKADGPGPTATDVRAEHLPKAYAGTVEVRRGGGSGWQVPVGAYFRRSASKRATHRARTGRA